MITIKLIDARRGLNLKCRELFRDERIAEAIYRYLCEGIEECENAEPERKTGKWVFGHTLGHSWMKCSECLVSQDGQTACFSYCPNCGAKMEGSDED